jgi:hypothetical protein
MAVLHATKQKQCNCLRNVFITPIRSPCMNSHDPNTNKMESVDTRLQTLLT